MKTGKRMIIANVGLALGPEERLTINFIKRIINSSLSCTALVQKSSVWCTIIWSKRWTSFTKNI